MSNNNISCIIPIFNERPRIGLILNDLSRIKLISEIICVDDGSEDDSFKYIKENFPKVILIKHPKNLGKSYAIKTGLDKAKSNYILLIDADLRIIDFIVFEKAISQMLDEKNLIDLLIFGVKYENNWYLNLSWQQRMSFFISGQRLIRKADLLNIFSSFSFKGYQLESVTNSYFTKRSGNILFVPNTFTHIPAYIKIGFIMAIKKEFIQYTQIIQAIGLRGFIDQYKNFEERLLFPNI